MANLSEIDDVALVEDDLEAGSASRASSRRLLRLANGIRLELVMEGEWLKGIGQVWCGETALRSGQECIWPQIATHDGWEVQGYQLLGVEAQGGGFVVRTRPFFRVAYRMDWTEHALHPRVNTASWSHGPVSPEGSVFEWRIAPEKQGYAGVEYRGLSYQFRYHVPGHRIYQIEDKATWELNGSAADNTFVMRGGFAHPISRLTLETDYYSGWTLPGIANPYIFQHLPLYSQMQGFTFQHDDRHVLLTVHEHPSHVRSLFHKDAGSPLLLHFNQFCFDLTDDITTPARRILLGAAPQGKTNLLNHFLRVRDEIQDQVRDYYGVGNDAARPSAHIETWAIARTEQFATIFKQLSDWGFRRAFVMPLWRSNETDITPRFSQDSKQFGVLGNMCCPLEYEIADCYGGWEGLRRIIAPATQLGIETYMWIAPHLSSLSPLRDRINDLFARDVSGQFDRNNYGHVLLACNQNSKGYQEYLIASMRKLKECGMSGVFRDSHFNGASDTINFLHQDPGACAGDGATADQVGFMGEARSEDRDMILTQHDAEVGIQKRLQQEVGLMYYIESNGVIGTPLAGTNYDWVQGCEFIWSNMETGMNPRRVKHYGQSYEMAYFRALSVRLFYQVNVEVNTFPAEGSVDRWWNPQTMSPLVRAYHQVEPHLKQMWLLAEDRGIRWTDGKTEVVFAYQDMDYAVAEGCEVRDMLGGQTLAGPQVRMQRMGIYLVCASVVQERVS